jgi:hypothetical protein
MPLINTNHLKRDPECSTAAMTLELSLSMMSENAKYVERSSIIYPHLAKVLYDEILLSMV